MVSDNVNHNIVTLDGNNTFHGMGVIVSVVAPLPQIQRKDRIPVSDLTQNQGINILPYNKKEKSSLNMSLTKRTELVQL